MNQFDGFSFEWMTNVIFWPQNNRNVNSGFFKVVIYFEYYQVFISFQTLQPVSWSW